MGSTSSDVPPVCGTHLLYCTFPPKPRTHRWYQSSKLAAVLVAKQHVSVVRQEARVSHSKTSEA